MLINSNNKYLTNPNEVDVHQSGEGVVYKLDNDINVIYESNANYKLKKKKIKKN